MSILLIRHGETASNRALVVQTPDVPLSERGLEQAGQLARRLATAGVARILSSDMDRAAMTAAALVEVTGAELVLDVLLHEHLGLAYLTGRDGWIWRVELKSGKAKRLVDVPLMAAGIHRLRQRFLRPHSMQELRRWWGPAPAAWCP